jgi:hypothetical protein
MGRVEIFIEKMGEVDLCTRQGGRHFVPVIINSQAAGKKNDGGCE